MEKKSEQELRISIGILIIDLITVVSTILAWGQWTKRLVDAGLVTVNILEAVRR